MCGAPISAAFCYSLVNDPTAVRTARRFTVEAMRTLGLADEDDPVSRDEAEAAVLVASELVTNACRHTQGAVGIRIVWDGTALTIEVDDQDDSTGLPEIVPTTKRGGHGGFGLGLVDQLAEAWGASHKPFGKTVFARMHHTLTAPACEAA